jgi:RNA polymerase sigma factor (TIGR02999 family)
VEKTLPTPSPAAVTELLRAWSDGDDGALARLTPLVETELRRLARGYMGRERRGHTLQPTALVNEAFLRLTDARQIRWQDRAHFLGISARLMRRVLVDHARARAAAKRGRALRVTLAEDVAAPAPHPEDVLELDAALAELASCDEREALVVELRFFGGLTLHEAAQVLGISLATAKSDWAHAKAWLLTKLKSGPSAVPRS